MKTKNIVRGLIAFLLIATTIVSLAYADLSTDIFWTATGTDAVLSVDQGEDAAFFVSVISDQDFRLSMEVLQGSAVVQTIVPDAEIPGGLDNPYSDTFTINTNTLAGDYTVRIHATSSDDDQVHYLPLHVETTPSVSVTPDEYEVNEGDTLRVMRVVAVDQDNDSLAFVARNVCSSLTYPSSVRCALQSLFDGPLENNVFSSMAFDSATGQIVFAPGFTFVRHPARELEFQVKIRAYDGEQFSEWEYITFTAHDVNQDPEINSKPVLVAKEGVPYTYPVTAADADEEDVLRYSLTAPPLGMTIDPTTGAISWTPDYTQAGEWVVSIMATDGLSSDSQRFMLVVIDNNRAPFLDPIGNKTALENQLLQFSVSGSDPDGDAITFTARGLPAGAVFDAATRTFSWTPGIMQVGSYNVTFRVSDGSRFDTEAVTIAVEEAETQEICGDGIDNDSDGLVDEDCPVPPVEVCGDGVDNDGDGLVDEDCPVPPVEVCGDGLDNDSDGLVDEDCPVPPVEVCGDGVDNDSDGLVDEDCPIPPVEVCGDSLDNDSDGSVDEDCPIPPVEVCGDGVDNDGDGLVDEDCPLPPIRGCINPLAENFNPQATLDDNSCLFQELDDILELTRVQLSSEVISAGETLLLNVHVANEGDLDLENLRVTVLAYDLGLNRTTSRFDLDEGRTASKNVALSIPDGMPAGEYLLKITVGNRERRESAYRAVWIR